MNPNFRAEAKAGAERKEHERQEERQRKDAEWDAWWARLTRPTTVPTTEALRALGIGEAEIERAFRAKAKELHPDADGDADQFRALVKARDALMGK